MKNLFFILCIVSVTSCNLLRVTPTKDPQTIADVIDAKNANHELYLKIGSAVNKTYTPYIADYSNIHARWDSLIVKNTIRKHAKKILKQCQLGMQTCDELENDHKSRNILTASQLSINDKISAGHWKALLVSELSLKN